MISLTTAARWVLEHTLLLLSHSLWIGRIWLLVLPGPNLNEFTWLADKSRTIPTMPFMLWTGRVSTLSKQALMSSDAALTRKVHRCSWFIYWCSQFRVLAVCFVKPTSLWSTSSKKNCWWIPVRTNCQHQQSADELVVPKVKNKRVFGNRGKLDFFEHQSRVAFAAVGS